MGYFDLYLNTLATNAYDDISIIEMEGDLYAEGMGDIAIQIEHEKIYGLDTLLESMDYGEAVSISNERLTYLEESFADLWEKFKNWFLGLFGKVSKNNSAILGNDALTTKDMANIAGGDKAKQNIAEAKGIIGVVKKILFATTVGVGAFIAGKAIHKNIARPEISKAEKLSDELKGYLESLNEEKGDLKKALKMSRNGFFDLSYRTSKINVETAIKDIDSLMKEIRQLVNKIDNRLATARSTGKKEDDAKTMQGKDQTLLADQVAALRVATTKLVKSNQLILSSMQNIKNEKQQKSIDSDNKKGYEQMDAAALKKEKDAIKKKEKGIKRRKK